MSGSEPPTPDPALDVPTLRMSASAVEKLRSMLEEEDLADEGGVRISARLGAGCSAPLGFDLALEALPAPEDLVLEAGGLRIFVTPDGAWSLDGLQVDWVESPVMGEGFAFRHPRGSGGRAC